MWVIHPDQGFFSAVEDKADPGTVVVRARVRADLDRLNKVLSEPAKIEAFTGSDYEYRLRIPRGEWARAVALIALDIDYLNMKDAVKARQGVKRATVYMRLWSVLCDLNPPGWRDHYEPWDTRRRGQQRLPGLPEGLK